MSLTTRPISIPRGCTLYDESARRLHGRFCAIYQTDGNGNELEVEGFYEDPGREERGRGIITFYLPGDEQVSYLNTSWGEVEIKPLGDARIVEGKTQDGKLKVGERIQTGLNGQLLTPDVIMQRLALGNVYRAVVIARGNTRIYCGELSKIGQHEIALTSSSGYINRLSLNNADRVDIRRIAKAEVS